MNTSDVRISRRTFVAASAAAAASGFLPDLRAKSLEERSGFHPGHYIALKSAQTIADIERPHLESVQGVSRRYRWRTLEPKRGEYDFSSIDKDLEALGQKQLVAFLIDKSHGQLCLPEYMNDLKFQGPKGSCPRRWDPCFVERYVALATAIVERFDDNGSFEGIAMQETALPASATALVVVGSLPMPGPVLERLRCGGPSSGRTSKPGIVARGPVMKPGYGAGTCHLPAHAVR